MATWMTHFRIADYFLDHIPGLDQEAFIVGNIGPDCGVPNEDWSTFTPSKAVSHWHDDNRDCRCGDFAAQYLRGDTGDAQGRSFYLGYYIHLVTDNEWNRMLYRPKRDRYRAQFAADKKFIWVFKRDWYDLDHLYLREHPGFRAFRIFASIRDFRQDCFGYYPETAYQRQIGYITRFYEDYDGDLDHEYPYLNKKEMDDFASNACRSIEPDLQALGLLP